MRYQTKAYLFAGLSILSWSTVATAFKLALKSQTVFQVLFIAGISSTICFFFYLLFSGKLPLLRRSSKREFLYSALLGLLNPFFYYIILFKAYNNLPAQVAQPLNMIWPIVLVLISIPFLGHKITSKSILALFISFAGIVLVSSQGGGRSFHSSQIPYMLLAVSTSVIWSFYWILNLKDKRDEAVKLFLAFLFSILYLLVWYLLSGEKLPEQTSEYLLNIYIGLFEMGFAFLFWLKALQYSESTDKISNLVFIFPFISLFFIWLVLGEKIHMTTIYGLLLVIAGITIQRIKKGKSANN